MSLNIDTDAVLLIDAENAFNSIDRKVIHNLKLIYSIIATYVINCYAAPSRLCIAGGGDFLVRGQLKMNQQLWGHMH